MGIDFVKANSSNTRNSVLQAQADVDASLRHLQAVRDQGVRDDLALQAQRDTAYAQATNLTTTTSDIVSKALGTSVVKTKTNS